jgi:hypothetical protein
MVVEFDNDHEYSQALFETYLQLVLRHMLYLEGSNLRQVS